MRELAWGRRYVMVRPEHFRVDYVINPYMDPAEQPDPVRALGQWRQLVRVLESFGGRVDVLHQRQDSPDMVYAMNLGLGLVRPDGPHVVMSHMRYPERRLETVSAGSFFTDLGFSTAYVGRDGVGAHFEAGDAFAWGDALVVGYGPRTEELALKHLATERPDRLDQGLPLLHCLVGIWLDGEVHERVDPVVHAEVVGSDHHVVPAPRELLGHGLSPPSVDSTLFGCQTI